MSSRDLRSALFSMRFNSAGLMLFIAAWAVLFLIGLPFVLTEK